MFTGIVQGIGHVKKIEKKANLIHFAVGTRESLLLNLQRGASIAIDGVCLTALDFDKECVWFDAIEETLQRTTFKSLKEGQVVNVERSAKLGDEIGGHILSGHVYGTVQIQNIERKPGNCIMFFSCPSAWTKYLFSKGFIALNGVSLTLVDVQPDPGLFSVHFIPETLQQTTFGSKIKGDWINLELDIHTQAAVDTVERLLQKT